MGIEFRIESELYNHELINEISSLYSSHYGVWGKTSSGHGQRIKLAPTKIREWTNAENARVATARIDGKLIGYAIAVHDYKNKSRKKNLIAWITQLVVHEDYRKHGIGKKLLFSFWGFSNYFAWGIMSSNPYAIRALEKATYRRVDPKIIKAKKIGLRKFAVENVSYVHHSTEFVTTTNNSKVNTMFPSDISKIGLKLNNVTSKGIPWLLGEIDEGWEWLAFTFQSQEKIKLTKEEMYEILDVSEKIAHRAYSKMDMDSSSQAWARHTKNEIQFIIENCQLQKLSKIGDFGCGIGRHTNGLIELGYTRAVGIDYSEELLKIARGKATLPSNFIQDDCRNINLDEKFDAIICLYDVIGSFIDNSENIKILENIYKSLKNDGYVLISVMNFELTKDIAKHIFSFEEDHNRLLDLEASDIMQKTGAVFNPDYYMIDKDTNIVYRREQFNFADHLPEELIVRDYRFTKNEIEQMCMNAGFKILFSRYVQAGAWDTELNAVDKKAKEILVLCKKSG
jgi:SAM-dependent methyltransferase/GNAT superfamily N-acetyltransferase